MSAKLNTARTSESAAPRYTLIRNIHLMNPPNRSRKLYDILLKKKEGDPIPTVEAIGKGIDTPDGPTLIIKGAGLIACRSFVDLHTHTCDPGQIVLEDIRTAGEAAVAGGYGDVLNIPYTPSPWSDTDTLKYLLSNYSYQGPIDYHSAFYLTEKNQGLVLADLNMLYQNGVRVFYEEGNAPLSLLYQGMLQIAALGGLLILRCNLPTACPMGNPKSKETAIAAEAAPLAAAIIMAEATHCRLHITTVSTAHAIDQIRSAKARGVQITCDTAPQYFTYTDQELLFRGGSVKVDPPLRSKLDKQAVIEGLADGTIDCIVSDHTPVGAKNKSDNIDHSVPGMLGLQTAFSLAVQELGSIKNDNSPTLELHQIVKLFTTAPAKILGLPETVEVGAPAKLIILDPRKNYVLTEAMLKSKSKNCPWIGQELSYKVKFNYAEKQKKLPKEPKSEERE